MCEIGENRAVWDLPDSCRYNAEIDQVPDQYYTVLDEMHEPVSGQGWFCYKKQTKVTTYLNWLGVKYTDKLESVEQLTRDECALMVSSKKCEKKQMRCNEGHCKLSEPIIPSYLGYFYLRELVTYFYECELFSRSVNARSNESEIIVGTTKTACKFIDLACPVDEGIVVWDSSLYHSCPFRQVERIYLMAADNVLLNKHERKLFQVTGKKIICGGMLALTTTGGLLLTNDSMASSLNQADNDVRIVDGLILSELDNGNYQALNLIVKLNKLMNEKICQTYKSFINLYTKLDDEFFVFFDFSGNEAVLYSDMGRAFVPDCTEVSEIEIISETKNCFKDFPVKVIA